MEKSEIKKLAIEMRDTLETLCKRINANDDPSGFGGSQWKPVAWIDAKLAIKRFDDAIRKDDDVDHIA